MCSSALRQALASMIEVHGHAWQHGRSCTRRPRPRLCRTYVSQAVKRRQDFASCVRHGWIC
eukprot:352873-Chlamydomonas_euryale.AAC.3